MMDSPPITSLTNARVQAAVRLRERRERDRTGLTLVDGSRELRRAVEASVEIETVFVDADRATGDDARWVLDRLAANPAVTVPVSGTVLTKLAFGDRDDGLVGVVRTPSVALANVTLEPAALIVIVETVEKPGNLGAILRSADGAGASAVVVVDPRTDPFNPNVIRASIGTIFGMPLAVATPPVVLAWLRAQAVRVITARIDGARVHTQADLTGSLAIVVGSEANGLSPAWDGADVESVRLPMLGRADSLNVAAATAVLLYEARRQRDATRASRDEHDRT